ncbi:MAG: PadR family transcriptional regulator [Prevotellaceae bacterium]|jgi:PadR family transcriptional regulator PadR|nr:PadR family transcriptional regulator [Prevotellaceae bacterium]
METVTGDNLQAQMRKGILEYCILLILSKDEASYASSIIAELKNAQMIVVEGTLYPLLTRLKNQGLLKYRWEESAQGPPRKYYSLTDRGVVILNEWNHSWRNMVASINHIREQAKNRESL